MKSAIILAALTAEGCTTVIEPVQSRDHSERMLRAFGAQLSVGGAGNTEVTITPGASLRGQEVIVPGDISSAAFWLVAAAITPGADLTVENVGLNPSRTGILDVLEQMGARIEILGSRDVAGEPVGDLRVTHGPLRAFEIGGDLIPRLVDEIPVLAVAACCAEGVSRIRDAEELRVKETDRIKVMADGLAACGVTVDYDDDSMRVSASAVTGGATLSAQHDHRIAMSFLTLGLVAEQPITVTGCATIETSFPGFASGMNQLGASIIDGKTAWLCNDCRFEHKSANDWNIAGPRVINRHSVISQGKYATSMDKPVKRIG